MFFPSWNFIKNKDFNILHSVNKLQIYSLFKNIFNNVHDVILKLFISFHKQK